MEYTPEQYAMLERFEKGLNIVGMEEEELRVYWFLIDQGLLQPRADIEDGLHFLSKRGKSRSFGTMTHYPRPRNRRAMPPRKKPRRRSSSDLTTR